MRRSAFDDKRFAWKALTATAIVVGVVLILLLARQVASVLLTVFAGVLLAVFLDGIALVIQGLTGMRRPAALALAIVFFFGFFVAAVWLAGPPVAVQIARLSEQLPNAIERLESYIATWELGKYVIEWMPDTEQLLPMGTNVLRGVGGFFWTTFGALVNLLLVLFLGIYMALAPELYISNVVRLFPIRKRPRMRQVFESLGTALRWWLVGRAASMLVVGILTALGLWIAGVPVPLALALIAALMAFVPFLGPVLGAIPAVLVALVESPVKVLYVIIVFTFVQLLENYFITPLIQQRAVSMAPALLITVQIVMAILFGAMGVLLATPLAVVFIVLVQMLYIHDVLGDRIRLLGEK